MEYIIWNGKYYPENMAVVSANNRGLRFGEGLFETLKSIDGQIQCCDDHFARLWNGMQILQFIIPKHFSPDHLQVEVQSLLKKNSHLNKARIRITVFKGDGGLYDDINHTPNYLIQSWALPEENGKWNSNGLVLGIYDDVKKSCDILCNLKHNNFLPYTMAAIHAKKQKWNDAVLLNTEGRLCETTIANIFIIKDGAIQTPALTEGCIAGVMRKNIIGRMKVQGFELSESKISINDLRDADEVFLTNSIYNMRWVQSVNDKKYGNQITREIHAAIFQTIS